MSLVPDFEIGVWNAWILMLYPALHPILIRIVAGKEGLARLGDSSGLPLSKRLKIISNLSTAVFIVICLYSIFLPLKVGTAWFYAGLPSTLLGLILFTITMFSIASTSSNEPFTGGMYRYSRHPFYVTWFVILIGVGIASASWLFFLLSIISTVPSFFYAIIEERACLERYGDTYSEYMNRTPRWIGFPKSG